MLVVGSATLSILLVVFAIYQNLQPRGDRDVAAVAAERARPAVEGPDVDALEGDTPEATVDVAGGAAVGAGAGMSLSLYGREGDQAIGEIQCPDWSPIDGEPDAVSVVRPEIRLRTKPGHAIKVTADGGIIRFERRGGGRIEARRGHLAGHVVMEIDRLTASERAALPPRPPAPDEIVRVDLDRIEFDVAYGKVVIPGPLRLAAVDAAFEAANLEIQFDAAARRIAYMRAVGGGRIELRGGAGPLGMAAPGPRSSPTTFVQAVVATVRRRLGDEVAGHPVAPAAAGVRDRGVRAAGRRDRGAGEAAGGDAGAGGEYAPMYDPAARTRRDADGPPVKYFARFEDEIDARQVVGADTVSRLRADVMEIVSTFGVDARSEGKPGAAAADGDAGEPGSRVDGSRAAGGGRAGVTPDRAAERIALTWEGRLVIESLSPDDDRGRIAGASEVTATGSPVRLASPDGAATCASLWFDPGREALRLDGTAEIPAVVRSAGMGAAFGRTIDMHRDGDVLIGRVTGPGRLFRDADATGGAAGEHVAAADVAPDGAAAGATGQTTTGAAVHGPAGAAAGATTRVAASAPGDVGGNAPGDVAAGMIAFTGHLDVTVREVVRTKIDLAGLASGRTGLMNAVRRERVRVLETANFTDPVQMRFDDMGLDADTLWLGFAPAGRDANGRPRIERLKGSGHIVMVRGNDRLDCSRIDARLTTDGDGRPVPQVVTATGDVRAVQGERTITARDSLVTEFAVISRPAPPFDIVAARAKAVEAGRDPAQVDWDAVRRRHEAKPRTDVAVRRLRAFGDVVVADPVQALDVTAARLDCSISELGDIETALLIGAPGRAASVQLDTFAVTGHEIRVDVADAAAEVPGPGYMTFRSMKDLDGRPVKEPIPIKFNWSVGMTYSGRKNLAVFTGAVHGSSRARATFECSDKLVVGFDDVPPPAGDVAANDDWWIFEDLAATAGRRRDRSRGRRVPSGFLKEPASVTAYGNAKAVTVTTDATTGAMVSRAMILGPRFVVNLRPGISMMLVEGAGSLLIEDYRPVVARRGRGGGAVGASVGAGEAVTVADRVAGDDATGGRVADGRAADGVVAHGREGDGGAAGGRVAGGRARGGAGRQPAGLLNLGPDDAPSLTLIQWQGSMRYDFSIHRTRFDDGVALKYFSGAAALELGVGAIGSGDGGAYPGRRTFLTCNTLSADFLEHGAGRRRGAGGMGGLSADRLRGFNASGDVQLTDESVGLWLASAMLTFSRDRHLLGVYGGDRRPAEVVIQRPGERPTPFKARRMFYDTVTGDWVMSEAWINRPGAVPP